MSEEGPEGTRIGPLAAMMNMDAASSQKPSGLVFVSGGSAINKLAAFTAASGWHAEYVVSVFDNGGSTGHLRRACGGFAVGDLRNRLVGLSRRHPPSIQRIAELASYRLVGSKSQAMFRAGIQAIVEGDSDQLTGIPTPAREQICGALSALLGRLPADFDWREAVIGNLLMEGRYYVCADWPAVLDWMHELLNVSGLVVPVATESAHIGARLANGEYVLGQSRITDENDRIRAPIRSIQLHPSEQYWALVAHVPLYPAARDALRTAKAIVYSWGSFYTSVLCSFLTEGFTQAIVASEVPKVLLLNPVRDAETLGKTGADLVHDVIRFAERSGGGKTVTHVFALRGVHSTSSLYTKRDRVVIEKAGVEVTEIECEGVPQKQHLRLILDSLLQIAAEETRR